MKKPKAFKAPWELSDDEPEPETKATIPLGKKDDVPKAKEPPKSSVKPKDDDKKVVILDIEIRYLFYKNGTYIVLNQVFFLLFYLSMNSFLQLPL